jgi:hypothetical protein
MAMPEGVNTFAGRLATFEGPRRLAKRRASSAKKKGPNSQEWPHQSPTAEQVDDTTLLCSLQLADWSLARKIRLLLPAHHDQQ